MPKQKTHKGLTKRIKITAGGKVKHRRAGSSHLMRSKNAKRRRRISSPAIITSASAKTIKIKMTQL
jgi:large subunit ribosomal protein L35